MSAARSTPGPLGIAAALTAAVAVVIAAVSLAGPLEAALVPTPSKKDAENREKELADGYGKSVDNYVANLNGRSPFFVPGPPPPPPPPPAPPVEHVEPPPPPPPSTYEGPGLIGMIDGVAWFADGKRLRPGESGGEIKLVRLDPPWEAVVIWKDIEFTIGLFSRDSVVAPPPKPTEPVTTPAQPASAPGSDPPAEPPATETPPPASPSDPPAPSEGPP